MSGERSRLSEAEREEERLLRELAADKGSSAAVRMRALEVLERKRARRAQEDAAPAVDEDAPDPFADFDELEAARQRRARRVPRGLAGR